MLTRMLTLVLVVAAALLLAPSPVLAEEKGDTHEGLVVKAGDGKLTMTDKDGKNEHTHDVAKDTKITCDGKACKLDDLKKGTKVKVTVKDKKAAKIEASTK